MIYTHKCNSCNFEFEVEYGINEEPEVNCPQCNESTHRIISTCVFKLQGSGWFNDGYTKKGVTTNE